MVIYVESVLIENIFVNAYLFLLTLFFLKSKIHKKRFWFSVVIATAVSCVLPLVMHYAIPIKIICLLLIPAMIRKNRTCRSYLLTVAVFCVVTLAFGGMVYALKASIVTFVPSGVKEIGILSVLLSVTGIFTAILVRELSKHGKNRSVNENTFDVTVRCGGKEVTCNAFFDTGNKTYAKNGEPVTIVEYRVYNRFCTPEGEILVSTLAGHRFLRTREAQIEIYSDDGANTIYQTLIASAPDLTLKENVLLHGDAFGG